MQRFLYAFIGVATAGSGWAEDVTDLDRLLCAATQAHICLETGDCYDSTPYELDMPDFVVIDTEQKTISTTAASKLNRSSPFASYSREDGRLQLQGVDGGRAFSFVIHEATGLMTAAIARDGMSVSVFGVCTAADP